MPKVWGETEETSKRISFNKFGQPNDKEHTSTLAHFLGTLARNGKYAPLNVLRWDKVPEKPNKEQMLQIVKVIVGYVAVYISNISVIIKYLIELLFCRTNLKFPLDVKITFYNRLERNGGILKVHSRLSILIPNYLWMRTLETFQTE